MIDWAVVSTRLRFKVMMNYTIQFSWCLILLLSWLGLAYFLTYFIDFLCVVTALSPTSIFLGLNWSCSALHLLFFHYFLLLLLKFWRPPGQICYAGLSLRAMGNGGRVFEGVRQAHGSRSLTSFICRLHGLLVWCDLAPILLGMAPNSRFSSIENASVV